MYSVRVLTNETCNQNCGFCNARRPVERAAVVAPAAVRARVGEAVRAGAREVVLTGGEPTLRRDLAAIVAHARAAGAQQVTLETNGALVDDARAAALAEAGLDLARVHAPLWGEACDAITRDEGGFAGTLAGMAALAKAGIAIEIAAPVVRDNVDRLATLPAAIAASKLPIRALVLAVPVAGPDAAALVPLREAARAIQETAAAARDLDVIVRLDPGAVVPPCLFPQPARVAALFSLTRGGGERADHAHLDGCGECAVRDRCPGVPRAALDREPGLVVRPIHDDKTRRRLSIVSTVEAQIERELVTRDLQRTLEGELIRENIVRVNFHCNQACRFCFVSTHLPPAKQDAIVAAIEEIGRERGILTLSGGEPTLNPRLVEYVALGKRLGARTVELQTNAIRLADGGLARALVEAGVDRFFVSLHASTAEVSDAITEAPGTFDKTVLGVDEIAATAATLRLNYVFCERNQADFPAYVAMVHARWPAAEICVSFVASSTDVVPREKSLVPRYTDVMPHLAAGLRLAKRLGVRVWGYESMCGVPLCQVPDDLPEYWNLAELPAGLDRGEFIKAEACQRCDYGSRCFGVRRGYAELHGTGELRPLAAS